MVIKLTVPLQEIRDFCLQTFLTTVLYLDVLICNKIQSVNNVEKISKNCKCVRYSEKAT